MSITTKYPRLKHKKKNPNILNNALLKLKTNLNTKYQIKISKYRIITWNTRKIRKLNGVLVYQKWAHIQGSIISVTIKKLCSYFGISLLRINTSIRKYTNKILHIYDIKKINRYKKQLDMEGIIKMAKLKLFKKKLMYDMWYYNLEAKVNKSLSFMY